jgi:hypothetical protein
MTQAHAGTETGAENGRASIWLHETEASQQKAREGIVNAAVRVEGRKEAAERTIQSAKNMGKVIGDAGETASTGGRPKYY